MISQKELHKILYESLHELGLTENERNLYVLSLVMGATTLSALAAHLGVPRPNVYKIIEGLEMLGLAKFSERKRYLRTFVVEPPTVITELLRRKREEISRFDQEVTAAMPDLLGMYSQGELPTSIKVIQGVEGYIKVFYQILDEEKLSVDFCGSVEDFLGFLPQVDQDRWTQRRLVKGIRVRTLALPGPKTQLVAGKAAHELREVRILTKTIPFESAFQLFANKVVIWQPRAPLALLVEDEYIVKMLRSLFETMWVDAENQK